MKAFVIDRKLIAKELERLDKIVNDARREVSTLEKYIARKFNVRKDK